MISKNLAQRIAVAAVAIPAILFLTFFGGPWFLCFVLIIAAVAMYEFLDGGGVAIRSVFFTIPFVGTVGSVYLIAQEEMVLGMTALLGGFLLIGVLSAIGRESVERLFSRMTYIIWGSFYIGLLCPLVYLIRGHSIWMAPAPGRWWLFFLFASIWVGDTAAMYFGQHFGRHKLAPEISPNKSWEGFWGCFLGIFVVAAVFKCFWMSTVSVGHFMALSVLIGLFGQLGDLVESLWKRSLHIKDSSALIPGHGGVLDRFDSLLFSAPVLYLYLKYILQAAWL